jgi:Flp pilus assembly protein TadG
MVSRMRHRQRGQMLVLLAISLVAIIAMVGLVLDGGAAYSQRRGQQNAADLAALAGAGALVNGQDATAAEAAAKLTATSNGWADGQNGVVVIVSFPASNQVKVDISAPHQNYFARVVGQPTWQVSVTATAEEGVPVGDITGAAPIIFSETAFNHATGLPYSPYGCTPLLPCTPHGFGDGNGDIPNNAGDVAWTLYGPNVNTNDVRPYLAGTSQVTVSFALNDYIGQSNGGFHNALFGSGTGVANPAQCDGSSAHTNVDTCLSGKDVVVPIVAGEGTICNDGHNGGCFMGWALFHVVSAEGSSTKEIQGYFVSGFVPSLGDLCADGPACSGFHGVYSLRLIN